MRRLLLLAGAPLLLAAAPATDWPCQQRLVPTIAAASIWAGSAPTANWRDNPAVATLVDAVADRRQPVERGEAQVQAFVDGKPGDEALAEAFTGLLDRSNTTRGEAIDRLRSLDRRLRALATAAGQAGTDLNALPETAPDAQRAELTERRALIIREYDALNRTIRYACEIPVSIEARLGRLTKVLQTGMP